MYHAGLFSRSEGKCTWTGALNYKMVEVVNKKILENIGNLILGYEMGSVTDGQMAYGNTEIPQKW